VPAGIGFASRSTTASRRPRWPAAYRPKAISLVMAGGILAAIFGPEIVKQSKDMVPPFRFLGTYLSWRSCR
jgi:hypothetical protein